MRSEYAANRLLQSTPSLRLHRTTADTSRLGRYPERRTLWGLIFFWL